MLRTTDRYILREVTPAFLLGLLVFTFILMLPPIMDVAEDLIAKGVDGVTVARIMATLVPQALGLTIPMALLIGVLMGLGRMSSDRETVALQACGVSIYRMLYPLMLLAIRRGFGDLLCPCDRATRCETKRFEKSRTALWRVGLRVRSSRAFSMRTSPMWCCTCGRCR